MITSPEPISFSIGTQPVLAVSQGQSSPISFSVSAPVLAPSWLASQALPAKPPEMAWLLSIKSSGSVSISGLSTTNYLTILWWDGTVQVVGPSATTLLASKSVPTTGNWSGSSPKPIYVWSGNRTQSGALTSLTCSSGEVVSLDVSDCNSLKTLDCTNNKLRSLDLSRASAVEGLQCGANLLTSISLWQVPLLKSLACQSNLLQSISFASNPDLEAIQINNNQLTSISLAGLSKLVALFAHDNFLASLDLRPAGALSAVNVTGNLLTEIRATGLKLHTGLGAVLGQNLLSASALNTFYEDVAPHPNGKIYVSGNPGTAGDDPSIATAKGYSVFGS